MVDAGRFRCESLDNANLIMTRLQKKKHENLQMLTSIERVDTESNFKFNESKPIDT